MIMMVYCACNVCELSACVPLYVKHILIKGMLYLRYTLYNRNLHTQTPCDTHTKIKTNEMCTPHTVADTHTSRILVGEAH